MSALEASVTLDDVFAVVGAKRAPLAPELAGYLALEIAEGADPAGGAVDPRAVFIGEEGTVALVRPRRDAREAATGDAETSVRGHLARLLEGSGSQTPALAAAAQRKPGEGLRVLAVELEAALIPVNRAAGRRALARLAREVKRVTHGVGRNATVPMSERPVRPRQGSEPPAAAPPSTRVPPSVAPPAPAGGATAGASATSDATTGPLGGGAASPGGGTPPRGGAPSGQGGATATGGASPAGAGTPTIAGWPPAQGGAPAGPIAAAATAGAGAFPQARGWTAAAEATAWPTAAGDPTPLVAPASRGAATEGAPPGDAPRPAPPPSTPPAPPIPGSPIHGMTPPMPMVAPPAMQAMPVLVPRTYGVTPPMPTVADERPPTIRPPAEPPPSARPPPPSSRRAEGTITPPPPPPAPPTPASRPPAYVPSGAGTAGRGAFESPEDEGWDVGAQMSPAPPPGAGTPPAPDIDKVEALLAQFGGAPSSPRGDKAVAAELKALVGLEPTPPPPEIVKSAPPNEIDAILGGGTPVAPASQGRAPSARPAPVTPSTTSSPPRRAPERAPEEDTAPSRLRRERERQAVAALTPKSPPRPRGRGARDVLVTLLAVVAIAALVGALWTAKNGIFAGRAPAPSADAPTAPRCRATLLVGDVPANAEVLLRVGQTPIDVDQMPVGARLEFVATADGRAPKRVVVPAGAAWDVRAGAKPRLDLSVQLEPLRAKGGQPELWPSGEPGRGVGGKGAPGVVHVESTPRGADLWLLAGVGPEARIEDLPCGEAVDLLVAGPTTLRKRLHVQAADLAPPAGTTGPVVAKVSAK